MAIICHLEFSKFQNFLFDRHYFVILSAYKISRKLDNAVQSYGQKRRFSAGNGKISPKTAEDRITKFHCTVRTVAPSLYDTIR